MEYLYPTNQNIFQKIVNKNSKIAQLCFQNNPIMKYMDTKHAADDMESLRKKLNINEINFYGISYGTLIGQSYAQRYPNRVNKMVLDGVVDHSINLSSSASSEALALEIALDKMNDWCIQKNNCPLKANGSKQIIKNIIEKLDRKKIFLNEKKYPGVFPRNETVDSGVFMHFIYTRMYSTSQWHELMHFLQEITLYQKNKIKNLSKDVAVALFESTRTYFNAGYNLVNCQDYFSDITDLDYIKNQKRKMQIISPTFWRANQNWDMNLSCLGWPFKVNNPIANYNISTKNPILYSNPLFDPITPASQAISASLKSKKAILSFSDSYGHSNANNSKCGREIQLDYFMDKRIPANGTMCHSFK